jgi:MYXO-CTERM domain-containing protein
MKTRWIALAVLGACALLGTSAQAHVMLTDPMNRYGELSLQNAYQKSSPCGHADNPPGDLTPVVFQAGETITITIDEYIQHTGFFRVAVADSDQEFIAPTGVDDIGDDPSTILVMADEQSGGVHEIEVTLPNTPCDPCVLQFIQIMTTGAGAFNDNYFQCADIVIEGEVQGTGGEDPTGDDSTTDATAGGTGGSGGGPTTDDSGDSSASTSSGGDDPGSSGAEETDSTGASGDPFPAGDATDTGDGCSCRTDGRRSRWLGLGMLGLLGLLAPRRRNAAGRHPRNM